MPALNLDTHEQGLVLELADALSSSLELPRVLEQANALLRQLLPSDSLAMCVSRSAQPGDYEWAVADMPPDFFRRYGELAGEDFVLASVAQQPNQVLRDEEMVTRQQLEGSYMYQYCRELGLPLEHVMAVLLDMGSEWHGGLTLYRARRQPYSERERALLQRLTPLLVRTVNNCRTLGAAAQRGSLLEELFRHQGAEVLVVRPPAKEVLRTAQATALLERWFPPSERGPGGLPTVLLEQLAWLAASPMLQDQAPGPWRREGPGGTLEVCFIPLPPEVGGRRPWALVLREVAEAPLPAAWRERLTHRELEVVGAVLRGWDNTLIAQELGCSLGTVKKHLQHVFDKLGVDNRFDLLHQATRR